jgi:hypothetical protein
VSLSQVIISVCVYWVIRAYGGYVGCVLVLWRVAGAGAGASARELVMVVDESNFLRCVLVSCNNVGVVEDEMQETLPGGSKILHS